MFLERLRGALRKGRPLVIGHRGERGFHLENTVEAFASARAAGADGVECDLRLTSDGFLVVFHDPDLARLAADPRPIASMTAAEARRIRLTSAAGTRARIPTADEMLEAVGPDLVLDLELKPHGPRTAAAAASLIDWLRTRRIADRVLVTSFDPRALLLVRRYAGAAGVRVARGSLWCSSRDVPWVLRRGAGRILASADVTVPCAALVTRAARRVPRIVWTVNDQAEAIRQRELGAAAIIGDDPAALRDWVARG